MSDVTTTTGATGAGGGNMIRLTGLSTGLDVDALVKKMLTAEQTKLDKAKQAEQTTQWKQEAYQDIIKSVKDLQSSFFDSASSDNNILSSTNFAPYTVSGVGTSTVDTSVATFTPGVGAKTGQYKITVTTLASGAGLKNSEVITSTSTKATLSTKLTDIDSSLKESINLTLNVNGGSSNINIKLDNTLGNSTLGDLVDAINNQGSGSVKATFSELTGEFDLKTSATGSTTNMTIESGSTDLSKILGSYTAGTKITSGASNANVTITPPGSSTGTTVTDKTSNNFTIDGMTYTLSSTGDASVNVGMDTEKVYDKIKDFVDKYNTVVDNIETKLTEKKDSDYSPLTDSQKSEMTTSQITAWETKAKVGILRNDDNLEKMLSDLRTAFTTAVSNAGYSLGTYGSNSIGIDTSYDIDTPAHIDISDASKLKTAITSNPDQVLKLFTNVSTTKAPTASDGTTKYDSSTQEYQEDGIFTRIKSILEKNVGYTNVTLNTATLTSFANKQYDYSSTGTGGKGTLPDQLYEQELKVKDVTSEMSTMQEKYYNQFSQLETVMTELNAQQSELSSLLGS